MACYFGTCDCGPHFRERTEEEISVPFHLGTGQAGWSDGGGMAKITPGRSAEMSHPKFPIST